MNAREPEVGVSGSTNRWFSCGPGRMDCRPPTGIISGSAVAQPGRAARARQRSRPGRRCPYGSRAGQPRPARNEACAATARRPVGSLLAFADPFLGQAIDQAASGAGISWDRRRLPPADFLLSQLQAANEAMLRMLRHAVQFGDSATVVRALAKWKMPDLPLARNAAELQASADPSPTGNSRAPQPAAGLAHALADAQNRLDAMLLRLLVTALDAERAARQKAPPPAPGRRRRRARPVRYRRAIFSIQVGMHPPVAADRARPARAPRWS